MPAADVIRAEIDVDERFIGEDYAVPSDEGTAAIEELAVSDGVFLGPVYTGKGFAGLLDHLRSGRIKPGADVAFIHTGDTGNLFEDPRRHRLIRVCRPRTHRPRRGRRAEVRPRGEARAR